MTSEASAQRQYDRAKEQEAHQFEKCARCTYTRECHRSWLLTSSVSHHPPLCKRFKEVR